MVKVSSISGTFIAVERQSKSALCFSTLTVSLRLALREAKDFVEVYPPL